jgi:3-isopropylmalate dehydrogenase
MKKQIACLPGDGIGPEVIREGRKALEAVGKRFGHRFVFTECLVGGIAYDRKKTPLPRETLQACDSHDAILFGAVGGAKWADLPAELTPERGALLPLRKRYELYANLRPAKMYPQLAAASPLREEIRGNSLDILVVRENVGGSYFGKKDTGEGYAADETRYTKDEIRRIARVGFEEAMGRRRILTSVDKANILDSSVLWRKTVIAMAAEYPEVTLNHLYVDNAAMQLAINPRQFDVIVTENLFGDILSDLSSVLTGSIGMLPSASLGPDGYGLYEPIHGSAPDIAGTGKANPLATILSAAMMLRYSFEMEDAAREIERAVIQTLDDGFRTQDIKSADTGAGRVLSTSKMGDAVAERIGKGK